MGARARIVLALLSLGTALACSARTPGRTLYEWTDADGNVRYTSHRQRIPLDHRSAARAVVATPEDTHGQYWTETPPELPRELRVEETPGGSAEAVPLEAPLPAVESAPADPALGPEPASADASDSPPPAEAAAPRPLDEPVSPLEQRIRRLESEVTADQEALKRLIADPESAAGLQGSPELREISERLPRLQAELRALRAQRAAEPAPAPDDGA
jgi:hypothetical protein